jgi:hypothetical protein
MKVYVTGAGASKEAGYPLGSELLNELDSFVRSSGQCIDRFEYSKWPEMCGWLETNDNLLINEAYRTGNIENIFSILDFANQLSDQGLDAYVSEIKKHNPSPDAARAEAHWHSLNAQMDKYIESRRILMWALEHYLQQKHHDDHSACKSTDWDYLRAFGDKLCSGDVVITFNYDSTLERVLFGQGKWFPSNGYGFRIVFQKNEFDETPFVFPDSPVKILHLHGAIGWYQRRLIKDHDLLPQGGGSYPIELHTPAPLNTYVGLDPMFLVDLGIFAVDASLSPRPSDERQIFIHPSFFKNYEWEGGGEPVFVDLWKQAADDLRRAENISIIGYSLPAADSAALTLFLTSCDRNRVRVINPDRITQFRMRRILRPAQTPNRRFDEHVWAPENCFKDWLSKTADCDSMIPPRTHHG